MSEDSAPRHAWSDEIRRIAAADTESGNGETIRTCVLCHMVMVTVHPAHGTPWNEFTMPGSSTRIKLSQRPACLGKREPVEGKFT